MIPSDSLPHLGDSCDTLPLFLDLLVCKQSCRLTYCSHSLPQSISCPRTHQHSHDSPSVISTSSTPHPSITTPCLFRLLPPAPQLQQYFDPSRNYKPFGSSSPVLEFSHYGLTEVHSPASTSRVLPPPSLHHTRLAEHPPLLNTTPCQTSKHFRTFQRQKEI